MFKHLLLPTDGTILSERAVQTGIELAHSLGARIEIAQGRACDLIAMARMDVVASACSWVARRNTS